MGLYRYPFLKKMGKPGKSSLSPGKRRYRTKSHFSENQLQLILLDIQAGKIRERNAAKTYNIPRNTLRNKRLGKHTKKVGRSTVFSQEGELYFAHNITVLSFLGMPISIFDVRCVAKSYLDTQKRNVEMFPYNTPGWD